MFHLDGDYCLYLSFCMMERWEKYHTRSKITFCSSLVEQNTSEPIGSPFSEPAPSVYPLDGNYCGRAVKKCSLDLDNCQCWLNISSVSTFLAQVLRMSKRIIHTNGKPREDMHHQIHFLILTKAFGITAGFKIPPWWMDLFQQSCWAARYERSYYILSARTYLCLNVHLTSSYSRLELDIKDGRGDPKMSVKVQTVYNCKVHQLQGWHKLRGSILFRQLTSTDSSGDLDSLV